MDLVNGHRAVERIRLGGLLRQPFGVAPSVPRGLGYDRGSARRDFGGEGERICLQGQPLVGGHDLVLVPGAGLHSRQENLPNARTAQRAHGVHAPVPEVPVADDPYRLGVWRPNRESGAGHTFVGPGVSAQDFPEAAVTPLVVQVKVEVPEGGPVPVGVVEREAG